MILVFLGVFLFFGFNIAFANILINEIMYAPTEGGAYEWMEVFNSGNTSVDINDWRFFNNKDDSSPLRLQKGSGVLGSGEYAIITNTSNWDSFSGMVFSSSQFSLPDDSLKYNTYKAISDSSKQIIDFVTYDTSLGGGKESGYSLSKISNSWLSGVATPGLKNISSSLHNDTTTNIDSIQNITETIINTKTSEIPKIKTKIKAEFYTFVGIPLDFDINTTGYSDEPLSYGKYFWNFGDGDSNETKASNTNKFTHTFFYEGEYVVTVQYFTNYYSIKPDAIDKITIKVVPADILISKVGDEKDFFVEIFNNTNYAVDFSGWALLSNEKSFILPKNTILESKKKIILSPKITNFNILDKDTLKLVNKQWETIFNYSSIVSILPTEISSKNTSKVNLSISKVSNNIIQSDLDNNFNNNTNLLQNVLDTDIPKNDLLASAVKSDVPTKDNLIYFIFILFIFLGIGASATYYIRNNNRKSVSIVNGDDFEILDE